MADRASRFLINKVRIAPASCRRHRGSSAVRPRQVLRPCAASPRARERMAASDQPLRGVLRFIEELPPGQVMDVCLHLLPVVVRCASDRKFVIQTRPWLFGADAPTLPTLFYNLRANRTGKRTGNRKRWHLVFFNACMFSFWHPQNDTPYSITAK